MAKMIQVTPEMLKKAAISIDGLASEYKAQYEALYNETGAMASTWQGKDNVAYTEQIAGFKDDFQKMQQLMLNYSDFLKKSAQAYIEIQENIAAQARKLVN